ncbi:MAG: hypothetical protein C0602_09815 [Denitrovibrio sp.]|nr:MAG: hypothetical protein C0602_09815 [Denitrovibrio sp.]
MELNKKGSVLIFVLIFIAFAASTVLLIHERSIKSIEESSGDFLENQAHIYAMTALSAMVEVLKDDDSIYDSRMDSWTLIPVVEVPYGFVSVDIIPLSGKIALNGLASKDEAIAARYMAACETIATEMEADSLECAVIKDYIDSDTTVTAGGEEGALYEYNGAEFRTKNAPLSSLFELRILMNNYEEFAKVKDYFTVYSPDDTLNINFASKLAIEAFLPEISQVAQDIESYSKTKEYKDPSNIQEAAYLEEEVYLKVLPLISVKSSLFYVKTEVTLNDEPRYYHALVKKDGASSQVVNFTAGLNGHYY